MLHVYIMHYEKTVCVEKIMEEDRIVAKRNFDTNMIDFDVCLPYIGQKIMVHNEYEDSGKNHDMEAKLLAVEEDNGIKSIRYQTEGLGRK